VRGIQQSGEDENAVEEEEGSRVRLRVLLPEVGDDLVLLDIVENDALAVVVIVRSLEPHSLAEGSHGVKQSAAGLPARTAM
jgi:hypothetical protein